MESVEEMQIRTVHGFLVDCNHQVRIGSSFYDVSFDTANKRLTLRQSDVEGERIHDGGEVLDIPYDDFIKRYGKDIQPAQ